MIQELKTCFTISIYILFNVHVIDFCSHHFSSFSDKNVKNHDNFSIKMSFRVFSTALRRQCSFLILHHSFLKISLLSMTQIFVLCLRHTTRVDINKNKKKTEFRSNIIEMD